jgi:hypothetical protein
MHETWVTFAALENFIFVLKPCNSYLLYLYILLIYLYIIPILYLENLFLKINKKYYILKKCFQIIGNLIELDCLNMLYVSCTASGVSLLCT